MERFLVAVDCSRVSLDCVRYLNRVLKGNSECEFVLFHVLPTASPNLLKIGEVHRIEALHTKAPHLSGYFWKKEDEDAMNRFFVAARQILIEGGFDPARIGTHFCVQSADVSDIILDQAANLGCSTIVVGRKTTSRVREFFLGSVTGSVVRMARFVTVWVVDSKEE